MGRLIVVRNVVLIVAPIIFITGQRDLSWSYLFSLDNQFFILYWLWIPSALWWLIGKDEKPSEPIKDNTKPKNVNELKRKSLLEYVDNYESRNFLTSLVHILIMGVITYLSWDKFGFGSQWFYVGAGVGWFLGLFVAIMLDDYLKNNPKG